MSIYALVKNTMMTILLIGDPKSRFVIDYAANIKKCFNDGISLHIFFTSFSNNTEISKYFDKVVNYPLLPVISKNEKINFLIRAWYLRKFIRNHHSEYNFIHILYVLQELALLTKTLKDISSRIILTVFGSDFSKISDFRLKLLKPVFNLASKITFANYQILNNFNAKYNYPPEKLVICRFGLEPLEYIRELVNYPQSVSTRILEIPENKIVITIGYNSNSNQQHLDIIKNITNEMEIVARQNELFFIFPLTYGYEPSYKSQIIKALKEFPFEYKILEKYLTENQNAHLRRSTDIFIQLQKMDQFSGSMQEHLYAGNVVITGSWLPYQTFIDQGILFSTVSDVSEIGIKLSSILSNLKHEKEQCKINAELIYEISSWHYTIKSWKQLYYGIS